MYHKILYHVHKKNPALFFGILVMYAIFVYFLLFFLMWALYLFISGVNDLTATKVNQDLLLLTGPLSNFFVFSLLNTYFFFESKRKDTTYI